MPIRINAKIFYTIAIVVIFQGCKDETSINITYDNLKFSPVFDSLLMDFSKDISLEDSVSIFVVIKTIDANTAKIYLVAKKPLRGDFESIGIPQVALEKNNLNLYFYSGLERVLIQDSSFFDTHHEIYDDRIKQKTGLFETPIVKKLLYIIDGAKIEKVQFFDDMIFIGSPLESVKFR